MSAGAQGVNHTSHPLLSALAYVTPTQSSYSFGFASVGASVNTGGYVGGDPFTRVWTEEEKSAFRAVAERMSEVALVTFTEIASASIADLNLQIVNNVPGGWAGYASNGGPVFVVGAAGSALLTHELGHSIWLEHPFDGITLPGVSGTYDLGDNGFNSKFYTIMAYRDGEIAEYPGVDFAAPSSLGVFDIAALQAMYGTNQATCTGDDTYGLTDEVWAIWDAGGVDAIDFSAVTTDGVIDLRAATLLEEAGGGGWASTSDLGGADVGAYMIAYGVEIENGFAGSGDDTVRGNDLNNDLQGGLGDDTLIGAAGNDVLDGAAEGASIAQIDLIEMNTAAQTDRSLSTPGYGMPGSVTIDMVVALTSGTSHGQQILSYTPDDAFQVGLEFRVWPDSSPYFYAIVQEAGGGLTTLWTGITKAELQDGMPHRLTVSRDAATGAYRFYLDGEFRNQDTHRAGEALGTSGTLMFGQSQGVWGLAGHPDYAMKGSLGEVAIYNAVLSDAEIATRSLEDLADTSDVRLISQWEPSVSAGQMETGAGSVDLNAAGGGTVSTVDLNSDNDLLDGGNGDDTLWGRGGDDTLLGGSGMDVLEGGCQDDSLNGGTEADTLNGGNGNDTLAGGGGADTLRGNDQDDLLDGGADGDFLNGGKQHDTLTGQGGDDTLEGANGSDDLDGGTGHDLMFGGGNNDTLAGGSGNDTLRGNEGKDVVRGEDGSDLVISGNRDDTLSGGAGEDTLRGQNGFDLLDGGADNDLLEGGNAGDTLLGGGGGDVLEGGDGKDSLNGGSGHDTLTGGDGDDTLDGGSGNDTFVLTGGWDDDVLLGFSSDDAEDIDLSNLTQITDFTDLITNHLRDNGGVAEIFVGQNSLLLDGITVDEIGLGLAYSDQDFIF